MIKAKMSVSVEREYTEIKMSGKISDLRKFIDKYGQGQKLTESDLKILSYLYFIDMVKANYSDVNSVFNKEFFLNSAHQYERLSELPFTADKKYYNLLSKECRRLIETLDLKQHLINVRQSNAKTERLDAIADVINNVQFLDAIADAINNVQFSDNKTPVHVPKVDDVTESSSDNSAIILNKDGKKFTQRQIAIYCRLSETHIKGKHHAAKFLEKFGWTSPTSGGKFYQEHYGETDTDTKRLNRHNKNIKTRKKILKDYLQVLELFKTLADKPVNKQFSEEKEAAQSLLNKYI